MVDADSKREDADGNIRDILLIFIGLAFAVSIQSLIEALKTVNSLVGIPPILYAVTQFTLFGSFLILGFFLVTLLPKYPRRKQTDGS
jgi:integral membrane sensor domain MASE1